MNHQSTGYTGKTTRLGLAIAASVTLSLAATTTARAAPLAEFGVSVGSAKADVSKSNNSDTAYSAFAKLGIPFGLLNTMEVGYTDFGSLPTDRIFVGGVNQDKMDSKAAYLAFGLELPLVDGLFASGKFGFSYWSSDAKVVDGGFTYTGSGSGVDTMYGLGAGYRISSEVAVRVDWVHFNGVGQNVDLTGSGGTITNGGYGINVVQAGVTVGF